MAEPRRYPLPALLACAAVVGAVLAHGTAHGAAVGGPGSGAVAPASSEVPPTALSSSWFCAGAKAGPAGAVAGTLVVDDAGAKAVTASVRLVSPSGYERHFSLAVPPGSATAVPERLPGAPRPAAGGWVGAVVTLYGGMATVDQEVGGPYGSDAQPCASTASPRWYFPAGETLRNASEEISLLNPYQVDAIADLSFTTGQGREQPLAFEGVVVPAGGLTVLNLGSHLRRRQRIAARVSVRGGDLVAFETEVVTHPPAGAPPVGSAGAANPVVPVPGVTLTLGATHTSTSLWWPDGGEGPGLSESYDIYNPGPQLARLVLSFKEAGPTAAGGASRRAALAGPGASAGSHLTLAPWGSAVVTTNGQPWALPGARYVTQLRSTNGASVVAERFTMASSPSPARGLGAALGQDTQASQWVLTGLPEAGQAWVAKGRRAAGHRAAKGGPEHASLSVANPGRTPAVVTLHGLLGGEEVPEKALSLVVPPGERAGLGLPPALAGQPLVLTSTRLVVVEQGWHSSVVRLGSALAPAVPVRPSP
ncbi:MAG: DUF5719 family protein [Acidimicrobiales bacterium]